MAIDFPALSDIPRPAEKRIAVRVRPEAERALRDGHPWLFEHAIVSQSATGNPGDLAVVFDRKRRFLAVGLYDPLSPIRVRVLQHHTPAPINREWFFQTLTTAARRRQSLVELPPARATTGYRLVYGENDRLPGMVIDRYAQTLVMKLYTAAWIPHLHNVLSALMAVFPAKRIVLRLSRALAAQSAALFGLHDGQILLGKPLSGPILFQENGITFEADPVAGQKTGFFLDQRDNRAQVETLAGGKSVLNLFSYTGGFSVYAARGGATEIISVDASAPALRAAERNFAHNRHFPAVASATHTTLTGDAFAVLEQFFQQHRKFDMVIIDPPMFAQKKSHTAQALAAYRRLTRLGLQVLVPRGMLVQASCSSRIPAATFFDTVHQTATRAGRPLREIARTEHPLDHPVTFPEGAYLKCLFAIVP